MVERWAVIFDDQPGMLELRRQHAEAHFAFLKQHKGKIVLAGGLREETEAFVGGLWVFEGVSRAEAEALIEQDPFTIHGLRAGYRVLAWSTAPGFEDMMIGPR